MECGVHRKVFVRVLALDRVAVFNAELQITGDDLTQRMVVHRQRTSHVSAEIFFLFANVDMGGL